MFCVVLLNCQCGQNIAASVYDTQDRPPSEAMWQDACETLQRDTLADFRNGALAPECPHCGSRYNSQWTVQVNKTECNSAEELHRHLDVASQAGTRDALDALGKRAMRGSTV